MAKPAHEPLQKPMMRNIMDDEAPTAANALTPINWPTIAASIIRYICCRMYPPISGTANFIMSRVGEPTVMSLMFGIVCYPFLKNPAKVRRN